MHCHVTGGWIEDCSKELGKKAVECCIREKSTKLLRDHNSIESSSLQQIQFCCRRRGEECDGLKLLINVCLFCGFLALYMAPAVFVYCTVMVVWSGSVVSLLCAALYSSVSCARFEERVRE